MHKLDHEDSVPTVSGNVCAVLVLPCPFLELSAIDWYWKKICGVPLLVRNIINLQRAGLDSLFIYDDVDGAELYKRLCEEKRISIKLKWITDVSEVIKSAENNPVLVVNGNALYTRQEIEVGINSMVSNSETTLQYFERETIEETLISIKETNKILTL